MVKPANKPNRVGEHQKLEKGAKPKVVPRAQDDDDDSRTERMPALKKALDTSEKLFKQATDS